LRLLAVGNEEAQNVFAKLHEGIAFGSRVITEGSTWRDNLHLHVLVT
jgi:hypothetical protein